MGSRPGAALLFPAWLLLLLLGSICKTHGQGLLNPREPTLGASNRQSSLARNMAFATTVRKTFRQKGAVRCSAGGCVLGAAADAGVAEDTEAILKIAGSPLLYSSADPGSTGIKAIGPAKDQLPCQTCTAFAAAAAAQAAVATVLGIDGSEVNLSVIDLYYCSPSKQRTCKSGANLEDILADLRARGHNVLDANCMQYNPNDPRFSDPFGTRKLCASKSCTYANPAAAQGTFDYLPVSSIDDVLEGIRAYGGVITQFNIYEGFKEFFNSNKQGVYKWQPGAQFKEPHAIFLVGYNLKEKYFIAQNSWGLNWADNGLFRLDFDFPGFLVGNTWAVTWTPNDIAAQPASKKFANTVLANRPNCCIYQAEKYDYLSSIARMAEIPNAQLLADNTDTITNLDEPLAGKSLLLCPPADSVACQAANAAANTPQATGSDTSSGRTAGGFGVAASSPPASPDQQLEALLAVKAAMDPAGTALTSWTRSSGAGGAFCTQRWPGVFCSGSDVVQLNFNGVTTGFKGTLPSGAVLAKLPQLTLFNTGMSRALKGTLPADWSSLSSLTDINIISSSVSGQLPASWGQMQGVQRMLLWGNALSGPLPGSWSNLKQLEELQLSNNVLTGQIPASWGSLSNLALLRLANNKFTGSLPSAFGSLALLIELRVELNSNLGGCIPRSLKGQLIEGKSSWEATKVTGFC